LCNYIIIYLNSNNKEIPVKSNSPDADHVESDVDSDADEDHDDDSDTSVVPESDGKDNQKHVPLDPNSYKLYIKVR
jgi:hypothetical protein